MSRSAVARTFSAAVLTVAVSGAYAAGATASPNGPGPGNSSNAQACQNGGWQDLRRSDGTTFDNQGDCVSYAAQGGTLTISPEALCESYGGTFVVGSGTLVWTCNDWTASSRDEREARFSALADSCSAAPSNGNFFQSFFQGVGVGEDGFCQRF